MGDTCVPYYERVPDVPTNPVPRKEVRLVAYPGLPYCSVAGPTYTFLSEHASSSAEFQRYLASERTYAVRTLALVMPVTKRAVAKQHDSTYANLTCLQASHVHV